MGFRKKMVMGALVLAFAPWMVAESIEGTTDTEQFESFYGGEEFVSIATGTHTPLVKAPAVASLITAEDIATIGARDLDEVLEAVPGLHINYSTFMYNSIYVIRGVGSDFNPQVLVLINGIPVTNVFQGDRNFIWGGMPVKSIARIEVIRGPGSALHGADAFAGVINIITKNEKDIKGTEAGVGTGSFSTQEAWLLHGAKWHGIDVAFIGEVGRTDGQHEIIERDSQTGLDALFGTLNSSYQPASLAPGPVNLGRERVDLRLDLTRGYWRLQSGFQGRYHVESGAGAGSLDPRMEYQSERTNMDLVFHDPQFAPAWDVTAQASLFHTTQVMDDSPFILFPPGADFSAIGGGAFPSGVIAGPEVKEQHARVSVSGLYTGVEKHQIRTGLGWTYGDLYDVREVKNFAIGAGGVLLALPGGVTDVSDDPNAVFLPEKSRTNRFVFIQDEWAVAMDWLLTIGVRSDDYSDFGTTTNPRLAVVWDTAYDLTTKLLLGRAFRAPSFAELYSQNNPIQLGNPKLDPETITTTELVWEYRPVSDWRGTLSLFSYRMRDVIQAVADPAPATSFRYQNVGRQKGYGFELESEIKLSSTVEVTGNYAYQESTDEITDADPGLAPQRQLYLRAEWRLPRDWRVSGQLDWIMDRSRAVGDTRPPLPDYRLAGVTLRRVATAGRRLGISLTVKNLFDKAAFEPVSASAGIPGDLPLAGRALYGEVSLSF